MVDADRARYCSTFLLISLEHPRMDAVKREFSEKSSENAYPIPVVRERARPDLSLTTEKPNWCRFTKLQTSQFGR